MTRIVYEIPKCVLHSEPYLYYCESCEEPICKKCTLIGPHNNELHLCNHINQSYRNKIDEIGELLNDKLPSKRQLVLSQISRLQYALEETKTVKDDILKYTKQKSLGILNRLQREEEDKTLYLKNLIQGLYNDLNSINDIGHKFENITLETNPNRMVQLLGVFKNMQSQLQRLASKIYNQSINVSADDLPRQLSVIRWKLQKIESYDQINKTKYQLVTKILNKRLEQQKKVEERKRGEFQNQMRSWKKETDYNLQNFQINFLMCHFCGRYMDESIINQECKGNSMIGVDFKGYCLQTPGYQNFGTSRHYFSRPKTGALSLSDKVSKLYIDVFVSQLKTNLLSLNVDVSALIKSHDPSSSGSIKRLDLMYILCQKCKVDQKTAEIIINSLETNGKEVKYQTFLQLTAKS